MERQLWVKRIADRVKTSETKIDEAMRAVMDLVQEVHAAQTDMSVSPIVTDAAMIKLTASMAALQTARTSVVGGHKRLDKIAEDLNLRTTGVGFDFKYLSDDSEVTADQPLERAVG
jgi:hypothetical protein